MYKNGYNNFKDSISPFRNQEPYPCVIDFCEMLTEKGLTKVCDLGCGSGRHAIPMAKLGFTVVALDMSQKALLSVADRARNEGLSIQTLRCALPNIPLADESFDAIVSTNVIHHAKLADIKESISEIHRILSPGGYVLLTVFSKADYRYKTGQKIEANTYYNTIGPEKDTAHHFFDSASLVDVFSEFKPIVTPLDISSLSAHINSDGETLVGTLLMGIFMKEIAR